MKHITDNPTFLRAIGLLALAERERTAPVTAAYREGVEAAINSGFVRNTKNKYAPGEAWFDTFEAGRKQALAVYDLYVHARIGVIV